MLFVLPVLKSGITVFGLKIRIFSLKFIFVDLSQLFKNFQGCITVYLSKIISTFSSCLCCTLISDNFVRISLLFDCVNHFFHIFVDRKISHSSVFRGNEIEYSTGIVLCQHLFCIFFILFLQFNITTKTVPF